MKKLFNFSLAFIAMAITSVNAIAATSITETEDQQLNEAINSAIEHESETHIGEIILGVLLLLAILAMLAHMVYEAFIRKNYRTDYTINEFTTARQEAGLTPEMNEQEAISVRAHLDEINDIWGEISSDGENTPYPLKLNHIKKGELIIAETLATMPTDEGIINKINGLNDILNHAKARTFNGSKTMIITAIILGIGISLIMGTSDFAIMVGTSLALYFFASRTANFVLVRKEINNKGRSGRSFLTGIIGGLIAGVATATTYKTVTKWSVRQPPITTTLRLYFRSLSAL